MSAPVSEDLSVEKRLLDIMGELESLHCRIDSLAGAAAALGTALDQPGGDGEPQIAYAVGFLFESLHRGLGDIIQDVDDLRCRVAQEGGAA